MEWKKIETKPIREDKPFLVLLPKNDVADYVVLQVSNFEGQMYSDFADGMIDWGDRILNATHWCEIELPKEE